MDTRKHALFLDRDGVINRRLPGQYVQRVEEFEFLPGVLETFPILASIFDPIVVVTNQQGVGKGLMSAEDLSKVHDFMKLAIRGAGGRIDGIYSCPHLGEEACDCRKPSPGLANQAQRDFPQIDFKRSVLAGDSLSDLNLGNHLGMSVVWIKTKLEEFSLIEHTLRTSPDFYLSGQLTGLHELADWWQAQQNLK